MIAWLVKNKYFRNENHAIWFLASFGVFTFVLTLFFKPFPEIFLLVPLFFHISPFITSILTTRSKEKSNLYSKDCIWFNGVMILIYLVLYLIFKF